MHVSVHRLWRHTARVYSRCWQFCHPWTLNTGSVHGALKLCRCYTVHVDVMLHNRPFNFSVTDPRKNRETPSFRSLSVTSYRIITARHLLRWKETTATSHRWQAVWLKRHSGNTLSFISMSVAVDISLVTSDWTIVLSDSGNFLWSRRPRAIELDKLHYQFVFSVLSAEYHVATVTNQHSTTMRLE